MTDTSRPEDDDARAAADGIPAPDLGASFDEVQPETQGESPIDAELGGDGQGDILGEDGSRSPKDDDAPDDLRVEDLP
ncbi:hypothetical protein [Microbacterium ulmi]|uniref:Uncharacterized protein n=1 Tax=Microbacterium ulmi TaxID=179095 RepID=A0A7Y2Q1D9_9MICO|nr:hypothetical protein [Microbacterium ulmi]NII69884.1 hypothetical protein [Microbacterium ulmi]NNH03805.1 hypothetical protein [Microbacterium ulmi]